MSGGADASDPRVQRVVDTVRVTGVDGRTLRIELVEQYALEGSGLVTVPANGAALRDDSRKQSISRSRRRRGAAAG